MIGTGPEMKKQDEIVTKRDVLIVFLLFSVLPFATFLSHHLYEEDFYTLYYTDWLRAGLISVGMGVFSVVMMYVNVHFVSKRRNSDVDDAGR